MHVILFVLSCGRSNVIVMIVSIQTDRSEQKEYNQIRQLLLILQEQPDQGLHYLLFYLHPLDILLYSKTTPFQILC